MTTHHQDIIDFHNTFDIPSAWEYLNRVDKKVMELRKNLIIEEVKKELLPAMDAFTASPSLENLAEVADALVDSVYVIIGAAIALDLPWETLWKEVQRSNMAKLQPDGSVLRREDGKVLKPDGWTPPDIMTILMNWQEQRMVSNHPELTRQYQKKVAS